MFYVGDLVSVMDEDVTGFLTRVDLIENKVFLDYCGMELCFSFSQIVKIDKSFDEKVAKGKIIAKDNVVKTYKTKKSKSVNSILEVDLHSHNLKGCRIGMTSHDVLLTQLEKEIVQKAILKVMKETDRIKHFSYHVSFAFT